MDSYVKAELSGCIRELNAIAAALEDAADEVKAGVQGMSTWQYTNALYRCAEKYRRAASKLSKIR